MKALIIPVGADKDNLEMLSAVREAEQRLRAHVALEDGERLALINAREYFGTDSCVRICNGLKEDYGQFDLAVLVASGCAIVYAKSEQVTLGAHVAHYMQLSQVLNIVGYLYGKNAWTRLAGINDGLHTYATDRDDPATLGAAVNAMMRAKPTTARVLKWREIAMDVPAKTVRVAGEALRLSRRELALMQLMLENQGGIVSRETIFARLYGERSDVKQTSIESHISRLRRRLLQSKGDIKADHLKSERYLGYRWFPHPA